MIFSFLARVMDELHSVFTHQRFKGGPLFLEVFALSNYSPRTIAHWFTFSQMTHITWNMVNYKLHSRAGLGFVISTISSVIIYNITVSISRLTWLNRHISARVSSMPPGSQVHSHWSRSLQDVL